MVESVQEWEAAIRAESARLARERDKEARGADPRLTSLTIEEAAAALRCGKTEMYAAIRRGEVSHYRIGNKILIPSDALIAYRDRLVARAMGQDEPLSLHAARVAR